ncbi:hypothetical protein [Olivibacter sitiensis]|uniref:hypothetical protein n=1 Tax=Olivibacter sitiensis TaxID=376470 RepID=UPI00041A5069|nr:hypothetical protein [Olivibacter sitiensis]
MRKTLLLLLIGTFGLGTFSGCTKTEYVDNMINPNRTYIRILTPGNWQRLSNNLVKYDVALPALGSYYTDDLVSVALSFDGEASYDILPATIDGLAYSVNYSEGWVTVFIQDPLNEDFLVPAPTSSVYMKVVISESEYIDD